ncbi:acetyltransferase [Halieaceae bacterium IMCC14734]|uniref:Acetyltransferase n=1 Tax=Candidatus Litorirhabdus singularis TaxID=2518993 RepID=A0ABT3TL01_9GAMM|nr:acetyltransferase [Candidatus Litorirhabdus singularis]MCX2982022.1 acetyltransferase [Candidatus Litorirhabdus singularis]
MGNILIIGASGHAKVIIDIVQQEGKHNVVGLLDPGLEVGAKVLGYPVLGTEEDLPTLIESHAIQGAIVAIGDNFTRAKVVEGVRAISPELVFVSAVHPKASMGLETSVGEGSVVMAGVAINPCSSVGKFCIVNTNASLDHDSIMEDFSSLAPGALTGGNCQIGQYSAVGAGAVLIQGIKVGEHTIIGAGSLLMSSVESFVTAYGTPAKTIRKREQGDKYS